VGHSPPMIENITDVGALLCYDTSLPVRISQGSCR
jgi:hypothetical protein